MSRARESIFRQLQENSGSIPIAMHRSGPALMHWSREEKIARLGEQLTTAHAEVHRVNRDNWVQWINHHLPERDLKRLLIGEPLSDQLQGKTADEIELVHYQQPIEYWKPALFDEIDVSMTSTRGGIACSGSLVLWPDQQEPRLMSLVPPVHVALLKASTIYESFEQMVVEERWASGMPTNALLISGPSKTADIQQVLAYGVHGPKQLIVLFLEDE